MDDLINIFQLIPDLEVSNPANNQAKVEEAKNYLLECGKQSVKLDEAVFVILLDHYIEVLKKAKSMLGHSKFTVKFIDKGEEIPRLEDFAVLTLERDSK
jgi:hypothetical protein